MVAKVGNAWSRVRASVNFSSLIRLINRLCRIQSGTLERKSKSMATVDEDGFQVVKKKRARKTRPKPLASNFVLQIIRRFPGTTIKGIQEFLFKEVVMCPETGNPYTLQQVGDIVYDTLLPAKLVYFVPDRPNKWYPM